MRTKLTVSNQPVGQVPDFEVSDELVVFLRTELAIDAGEEARARLRWIVRNFMADTKRHHEAHPVNDLRATLQKLRGGAVELLSNLQAEPRERRETIRRLLVSAAEEPLTDDAPEEGEDDATVSEGERRDGGQVIDEIQVSLLLLSRASSRAMRSLDDADDTQPGGYASAWRMFVPDLKSWIVENGGVWKLPRNDTDKSLAYHSTPSLELVKLILAALPSDYAVPIHSDQALAKKIREALPKRGGIK